MESQATVPSMTISNSLSGPGKRIQFKSLFVSSGLEGLGATLSSDIHGKGAVVTALESPLDVAVIASPASTNESPQMYESLEAGDVLVQLDGRPVWNVPHTQVLNQLKKENTSGHVLLFLEQMSYYRLRKTEPHRLSAKITNPAIASQRTSWFPMLSGFRTPPAPQPAEFVRRRSDPELTPLDTAVAPSLNAVLNGPSPGSATPPLERSVSAQTRASGSTALQIRTSQLSLRPPGARPGSATPHLQHDTRRLAQRSASEQSKADAAMAAGKHSAAVNGYTKAILLDPTNHILASNRSVALLKLGRPREACLDALRCVRTRPEWPMGYLRLATALEALGATAHLRSACGVYAAGLVMSPSNPSLARRLNRLVWRLAGEGRSLFPGAPVVVLSHPTHLRELNASLEEQRQTLSGRAGELGALRPDLSPGNAVEGDEGGRATTVEGDEGGQMKPVTSTEGGQTKPVTSTEGGQMKPGTSTEGGQMKPGTSTEGGQMKPGTSTEGGQMKPVTSTEGGQTKPVTSTEGGQTKPVTSTEGGQTKPGTSTEGGQMKPVESSNKRQTKPVEGDENTQVRTVEKLVIIGSACSIEGLGYYLEPLYGESRSCVVARIPSTEPVWDRAERAGAPNSSARAAADSSRKESTPWYALSYRKLTSSEPTPAAHDASQYISDGVLNVGDVVQTINGAYVGDRTFNEIVIEMELASPPLCLGLQSSKAAQVPTVQHQIEGSESQEEKSDSLVSVLVSGYGLPVDGEYIPQESKNNRTVYQNENGVLFSYEVAVSTGGWVIGLPPVVHAVASAVPPSQGGALRKDEAARLEWFRVPHEEDSSDEETILDSDWTGLAASPALSNLERVPIHVSTAHRLVPSREGLLNSPLQTVEESFQSYMEQFVCGQSADIMGKPREIWSLHKHALAIKGLAHRLGASGDLPPDQHQAILLQRDRLYTAVVRFLEHELEAVLPRAKPGTPVLLGDALLNRSRVRVESQPGTPDEAVAVDLRRCLALVPGANEPLSVLVAVLVQQGELEEAAQVLESAKSQLAHEGFESGFLRRLATLVASARDADQVGEETAKSTEESTESDGDSEEREKEEDGEVAEKNTEEFLRQGGKLKKLSRKGVMSLRLFHCSENLGALVYTRVPVSWFGNLSAKKILRSEVTEVLDFEASTEEVRSMQFDATGRSERDSQSSFFTLVCRSRVFVLDAMTMRNKLEWIKHLRVWANLDQT